VKERPRVPAKSSGSAPPNFAANNLACARARMLPGLWAGAAHLWLPTQPIRAETTLFTCCPVPHANSALPNVFAPGEPRLPSRDECDSRARVQTRVSPSHLIRSSSSSGAELRTACTGLCRCAVGHDDHMHVTRWPSAHWEQSALPRSMRTATHVHPSFTVFERYPPSQCASAVQHHGFLTRSSP
jgi:hypothetical protein